MQEIIAAAVEYIKALFADNSDGHGADHSLRVYKNALLIAATEQQPNIDVVSLAALLHDVDDRKLFRTENNANARSFLEGHNITSEVINYICDVINSVSFSKNKSTRPATIEGQIVQDADRLDAIGAIGIVRAFSYGGKHGIAMEDSILHFHSKLLLLQKLMNTKKAMDIAQSRHIFMQSFLEELNMELREPTCESVTAIEKD